MKSWHKVHEPISGQCNSLLLYCFVATLILFLQSGPNALLTLLKHGIIDERGARPQTSSLRNYKVCKLEIRVYYSKSRPDTIDIPEIAHHGHHLVTPIRSQESRFSDSSQMAIAWTVRCCVVGARRGKMQDSEHVRRVSGPDRSMCPVFDACGRTKQQQMESHAAGWLGEG